MARTTELVEVQVSELVPYQNNAKRHPAEQIEKLKRSIEEFGFVSPCIIDRDMNIIAGHGRVEAAKALGLGSVPCVFVEGLTEEQRRAYILADNRLTELGGWDETIVRQELEALDQEGFDVDLTGFDIDEYLGDETVPDIEEEKEEPLPDSHIYVYSVSAFGRGSDLIAMVKLPQDAAEHFLEVAQEKDVDIIAQELLEAVYGL